MSRHVYSCPLRWADMDVYGIVNNVVYLRLLEQARVDLVYRMSEETVEDGDAFLSGGSVVVKHTITYRNQLTYRHRPVDIEMWVSDLGSATVTVDYEVRDGDTVYAVASTTMAAFDYVKRRPRRLTDTETEFFGRFVEPCAC